MIRVLVVDDSTFMRHALVSLLEQDPDIKVAGTARDGQDALKKAVASAYEKAQVLAAASGAAVGRVISIREISGYSDTRYTDYARSNQINSLSSAKEEALADTAGMMPGEVDVEAGIVVEYQLVY